ncbi:transcription initiation factor TFIID subunit 9B isoform X4 [Nycticebus coucang]|uniref:transcription initiation factor TFIID subunit 9B isoform X4 n=1 Tax=Nycticebus coucang TaxID=9470 RepID=UPI00234D03E9|nr:transcription initiation factor TFIID subunit 9B isoform X4 [Nycticebus coucang]
MESGKMAPPKNAPRDALVMAQILKDMGITEYEPRVINQMLEFAFRYVTTILDDAKIYSSHAKKPNVDADDVRLAIQCRADRSFTSPPPRDGPNQGRVVPRLSVGAVSSRPTTPTIATATPQTVSVPNKVATPVSVASQRFTVQIPPSQTTPVKPVPATTAVQNVLINPSMIGPKNILITTNMVSSQNMTNEPNPLKRKHEDDDSSDTLVKQISPSLEASYQGGKHNEKASVSGTGQTWI